MKCDICGKSSQWGHAVSHSMRHTKRRWLPNIQVATLIADGRSVKVKLCTRCLRTTQKTPKAAAKTA